MSENIIEKVRRLRALAESTNVHEAAAAAKAAERLIQEHNLSEAALHVDAEDERVSYEAAATFGQQIPTWQSNLLHHLSRAYQCCGFFKHTKDGYSYVVYGRPSDLETLAYQYAFFTAEIARLTAATCKGFGRTFSNSFRLGSVQAIGESLSEARTETRKAATSSALVVVDRRADLAKERRNTYFPDLKSSRASGSCLDATGFALGRKAGAGISQRTALGEGGTKMLAGKK